MVVAGFSKRSNNYIRPLRMWKTFRYSLEKGRVVFTNKQNAKLHIYALFVVSVGTTSAGAAGAAGVSGDFGSAGGIGTSTSSFLGVSVFLLAAAAAISGGRVTDAGSTAEGAAGCSSRLPTW